jgi:hypothetical protein
MSANTNLIPAERIERQILLLRGQKVLLDFQLAELYGVPAKVLNQSVKRNIERFPDDFMFQLSDEETLLVMRSQIVTSSDRSCSKSTKALQGNWSQIVTSSKKHRGLVYRPYAFTEQGVAMLSSVLRSQRAVQVNIAIMRTFVQLRQMLASNTELARKLAALEAKYDEQFKVVFDAIRELMARPDPVQPEHGREIGFHSATKRRNTVAVKRSGITA